MRFHRKDISIILFLVLSSGFLYILSSILQSATDKTNTSWMHRLLANLSGYAVLFIPGYIVVKYIYRTNYVDNASKGCLWPLIKQCIYGQEGELISSDNPKSERVLQAERSFSRSAVLLFYCFCGLQSSYLVWGLLQEKIMTQSYSGKSFTDSQFLVFVNRILALVIAWIYLIVYESNGKSKEAPLYKYSYCAFSNVMSSWFQYEALKFVSFPTQVLAKACKIIPVMLMGKLISHQIYEFYEYLTAVLISLGMILFLSGSSDTVTVGKDISSTVTTSGLSGLIILIMYMVFDSFTSNWQDELFRTYRVSSVRMMAGVNLFSCLLTGLSLVQQGTLLESAKFIIEHHDFAVDCVVLSFCSALGQLFIYYTIEKFGAVIFITIMTIRQALAVLLSCIFYHHPVSGIGIIGVIFVFLSVFLRTYCSYRLKQIRNKQLHNNTGQIAKV